MKGDPKVIDYLNKGLRSELTAINQYWLHFRLLDNWGLKEMSKVWRKESIEEMHHADRFTDRILFLDGFPNMQVLDPLRIGQNVKEIIECDLAAEHGARHPIGLGIRTPTMLVSILDLLVPGSPLSNGGTRENPQFALVSPTLSGRERRVTCQFP